MDSAHKDFFSPSPLTAIGRDHFVFVTAVTEAWRKGPGRPEDEDNFRVRISIVIIVAIIVITVLWSLRL